MPVLDDLIKEKFGGLSTQPHVNRLISSVGTTIDRVIPNDPNRVAFIIINLDEANTLYILPEPDVSPTRSIPLGPGQAYVGLWDEDFQLVGWDWYCVGSAAGTALLALEVVAR